MKHKPLIGLGCAIFAAMALLLWSVYFSPVSPTRGRAKPSATALAYPTAEGERRTNHEQGADTGRTPVIAKPNYEESIPETKLPPGFHVEPVVRLPDNDHTFSLINLTFDDKGRLLVSREDGPVLLCTGARKDGTLEAVKPYCEQVKNCHGMCWVNDALFLVGSGPEGMGLYRARDTKDADKTDEVKLLHRFPSSDLERGPHAILHGPDGWLYVVVGYQGWASPKKLADNSPLQRWPQPKKASGLFCAKHPAGHPGKKAPTPFAAAGEPSKSERSQSGQSEDILLPQLEDPFDHATGISPRGGTIWRLDYEGKNASLIAVGLRNAFDAAFSPTGELFTFDGDMETDVGLPWYRPVRICHCPPGADFVWRSGTGNTPDYYIDSLPAALNVGRGCPVGMEFYDHSAFPEKYRGVCFMAEWSQGLIYAVRFERNGAGYTARLESFCQDAPQRITDVAVGPDGALYFTTGGRGRQGGVYRIVHGGEGKNSDSSVWHAAPKDIDTLLACPQPYSAWSRARQQSYLDASGIQPELIAGARNSNRPLHERIRALDLLTAQSTKVELHSLLPLADDPQAEVRAHVVTFLGRSASRQGREVMVRALGDESVQVRRRACEALIRAGIEPPVEALWPLLNESDRFVRTAARLVLQRIDPRKWTERLWQEDNDLIAWEGIIALCKTNQAKPYTEHVFARLRQSSGANPETRGPQELLDYLRTMQMALIHTDRPPARDLLVLADRCYSLFPSEDWRVNRELAILMTYFCRAGVTSKPVHVKLLDALPGENRQRASGSGEPFNEYGSPLSALHTQQMHYFHCLRLLHEGWTQEQMDALLSWYHLARSWQGGHRPFLARILDDARPIFADRLSGSPNAMASTYVKLLQSKKASDAIWRELILERLAGSSQTGVEEALRLIADRDPAQKNMVARSLARFPTIANWTYLAWALDSADPLVIFEVIEALKKIPASPQPTDASTYRNLILACRKLDDGSRWKVVELLRHWNDDKQFGAIQGDWQSEMASWSRWFAQTFPLEPALPNAASDKPAESRHQFDDVLVYLEAYGLKHTQREYQQSVQRGQAVFEKAQCMKCHRRGTEGDGIGPDLANVSRHFKRADVLQKLLSPSKFINDRYRSTVIVTKRGQQLQGLTVSRGETVEVFQADGTKVILHRAEIDRQFASLVSIMPPNLLDSLTREEIADLFMFLESGDP